MLVLLMAAGLWRYVQEYVSISNNVNGREMPICSVETQEKKVALTFDVSWGNKDNIKSWIFWKSIRRELPFLSRGCGRRNIRRK